MNIPEIFEIKDSLQFNTVVLETFNHQYRTNPVYREYCQHLNKTDANVANTPDIPYLPIEFFRDKMVISNGLKPQLCFSSSGTTGKKTSKHFVADLKVYEKSFVMAFNEFYQAADNYCILALLPSYMDRQDSSLIYMVATLINKSGHPLSGFYLDNLKELREHLKALDASGTKVLLIGVSYALLDLAEGHSFNLRHTIIMETGGMKGRRREMVREELHAILKMSFGVSEIHSEYGMTELLSQAYSKGGGIFRCPPWMKVMCRDPEDPLLLQEDGKTGGINIIDLANVHSCSFIATQDLGKVYKDGSFEVLGRFDHSDIRGCNLMVV